MIVGPALNGQRPLGRSGEHLIDGNAMGGVLGMVARNESFFQVVPRAVAVPAPAPQPRTRTAQR